MKPYSQIKSYTELVKALELQYDIRYYLIEIDNHIQLQYKGKNKIITEEKFKTFDSAISYMKNLLVS